MNVQVSTGRKSLSKRFFSFLFNPFSITILAIGLSAAYWGLIASGRYISEARVVVNRTDSPASTPQRDLAAILTGTSQSGLGDILVLRDHLMSIDMMNLLDKQLGLKAHYSDSTIDRFSRFDLEDPSMELFHEYFLTRVSIDIDQLSGSLVIKAQAFTPQMANQISSAMVKEGEKFLNESAHKLAREQVAFLEGQVTSLGERVKAARKAALDFQNRRGLQTPKEFATGVASLALRLETSISELTAKRNGLLGYLSPDAPDVVQLDYQIKALKEQYEETKSRLKSDEGSMLASAAEHAQLLQTEAEYAQDMYKTSLMALERGRVEASRVVKKISVIQSPTMPEYAVEPRRLYKITVYSLVIVIMAGIMQLLTMIVRDHKD